MDDFQFLVGLSVVTFILPPRLNWGQIIELIEYFAILEDLVVNVGQTIFV